MSLSDDVDLEVFVMSKDDLSGNTYRVFPSLIMRPSLSVIFSTLPFLALTILSYSLEILLLLLHSFSFLYTPSYSSMFLLMTSYSSSFSLFHLTLHHDRGGHQGGVHRSRPASTQRAQNESYTRRFREGERKDIIP